MLKITSIFYSGAPQIQFYPFALRYDAFFPSKNKLLLKNITIFHISSFLKIILISDIHINGQGF